ncbi:MAG: hypothetical protein JSV17_01330 [Candidatus Aminicenantes bacterium]|nr:MAG: hypothetical protein JSV17_01330 [Candidatus Aminicenantes bacterium]
MDTLPGGYFYPAFFENFAPDTTILIEENNGFSLIDMPLVYFEGDSFTDFNWFHDGYNINSVLESGTSAIRLPLSSIQQYELKGESPVYRNYGLNFVSPPVKKTYYRFGASKVWPHMGSFIPASTVLFAPHPTSEERSKFLYSERRKILSNYLVDFSVNRRFLKSAISLSLTYYDIERQFNDFGTFDETFAEKGKLFLLQSKWSKEFTDGMLDITAAYNSLFKNRAFAELGRLPQETLDKNKESYFAGINLNKNGYNVRLSYAHEKEELVPTRMNFQKDLKDNDGEGFFPFERWGSFSGNVFRLSVDKIFSLEQFIDTEIGLFADLKHTTITGQEKAFDNNPINVDQSPYLVILWDRANDYRNYNAYAKAGTMLQTSLAKNFNLYAKLLLQYSFLRFVDEENNLSSLAFGFDLGIEFHNKNLKILLAYERMPYEIREDVNFFLEKQRPWGTYHFWKDENQDFQYQTGEEGEVFGYTGGNYHSVDENIATPFRNRFLLSLSARLSQKFSLNVKSIIKSISNNYWIKFKDENGFYQTVNDREFYFFSEPFTDYSLSNASFEDNPFYLQFLLHLVGKEAQKWYFSFSFMAHLGMGNTAFGNGPGANDFGILDESQANPNTWINGYGRVDGDRAFVGKLFFGFYLTKNLFLSASLKYRDGTPFAFIGSHYANNQWIFYLETIQAENRKGIKGGPREDFLSDVSVKLKYNFQLFDCDMSLFGCVFNVLDFGSELSEYVFSDGKRFSNELIIPRSVRAGLKIEF